MRHVLILFKCLTHKNISKKIIHELRIEIVGTQI